MIPLKQNIQYRWWRTYGTPLSRIIALLQSFNLYEVLLISQLQILFDKIHRRFISFVDFINVFIIDSPLRRRCLSFVENRFITYTNMCRRYISFVINIDIIISKLRRRCLSFIENRFITYTSMCRRYISFVENRFNTYTNMCRRYISSIKNIDIII